MFEVEYQATIQRPIETVFQRLTAIDDYSEWLPRSRIYLGCEKTSPGPLRAGSTFLDRTPVGTFEGEVHRLEAPEEVIFHNKLDWFGMPVMESFPGYQLKTSGGSTHVRHFGHGRCFGIFKLAEPLVARLARVERQRTLMRLKHSLESESKPS